MRLNNADMVERAVIRPMMDRGLKPRAGAKLDVLVGDYADALGSLPETALASATRDVLRDWEYHSWPMPGAFRKAASRYTTLPGEDNDGSTSKDPELSRRNKAAYDYARGRLLVNDAELLLNLMKHGPWMRQQIEKFLYDRAVAQLKGGALQAHVSNADLEAEIASLVGEQEARIVSQEKVFATNRKQKIEAPAQHVGER
jgi:hypothetical protein